MAMRGFLSRKFAGCFATYNACPTATSWQAADWGGAAIKMFKMDARSSATAVSGVLRHQWQQ
jgi:hypothetical protein